MAATTSKSTITETPVWFITGCSTGFGRELAKHALERGHRTVVTARDPDEVKDLAAKGEALVLKLDVTDQGQIDAAIKAAEDKFGRIDVLSPGGWLLQRDEVRGRRFVRGTLAGGGTTRHQGDARRAEWLPHRLGRAFGERKQAADRRLRGDGGRAAQSITRHLRQTTR